MSVKPRPGGSVMISRKLWDVLQGPELCGARYRLMVRDPATRGAYWAYSSSCQRGCGPWKISGPVVDQQE